MRGFKGREVRTEAIVLRARTTGEDDLLVEFLTPGEGRVHGIARHGRKSRKRFGTVLESFNRVRLRYQDAGGLVSLREAALESGGGLEGDLERLLGGFYLVDLIRASVHERNPDAPLYHLLEEGLLALASGEAVSKVIRRFEFRFLDLLGYKPHLGGCLLCGRSSAETPFFFVFSRGGVFCGGCLPPGVSFEPYSEASAPKVLSRFIEYQLGHPLRSHKFLTDAVFSV